jgi:hypothetical protein
MNKNIIEVGGWKPYIPPHSERMKNGRWVRFEFDDSVSLVICHENQVLVAGMGQIDPSEYARLKTKIRTSGDGRYVGVYNNASSTPSGNHDADGRPIHVYIPATVTPLRAVLGLGGEQSLYSLLGDGATAYEIKFLADALRWVEGVKRQEDVPEYRTVYENWNP